MRTRGDRRPVVVTLLVSRGPRFSARWSRRSSRHESRGGIDVSKGSATAGMLAGRWQALRSHLSLALASATDCHCMFSAASIPPQAKGSTCSTTYPGHGPVRPAVDLCRARSRICRNNRSVLTYVGANLNRSGGLRNDGLAGGLANQKQGNDQTHKPCDGRICSMAVGCRADLRPSPAAEIQSEDLTV